MNQGAGDTMAAMKQVQHRRYRQLIASWGSLSDAQMLELSSLMAALGKRDDDLTRDADVLRTADALKAELSMGGDVDEAWKQASIELVKAHERRREKVAALDAELKGFVAKELEARGARARHREAGAALGQLIKRSPELFADELPA